MKLRDGLILRYCGTLLVGVILHALAAGTFAADLEEMLKSSCLSCHDADTETRLDFTKLSSEFTTPDSFRRWVRVFDRLQSGEMPPPEAKQLSKETRSKVLSFLESELKQVNLRSQQTIGRVPSRRLSRLEFEHTLQDLLGTGGDLARFLPLEDGSGAFDSVASKQGMSSVHVRGLLTAVNAALDEAIQLGPKPRMEKREINYHKSPFIQMWVDRPIRRGGGTVFKTDRDVVTFRGENYVFRSDHNGYRPPIPGRYRITVKAAAYQPRSSITVSLKRQNDQQGQSELFAAWDLTGDKFREVSTTTFLRPDDYFYVSADELDPAPDGKLIYNSQPASKFGGEGVRIRSVTIEGPLEKSWPPERTRKLFPGIQWRFRMAKSGRRYYEPVLTQAPEQHAKVIVKSLAERAWRRKPTGQEVAALVQLAKPAFDAQRDFVDSMRIPLRAVLLSPHLMFQNGGPGPLDETALASRLSYFLWRTLPDKELLRLAEAGRLSEPQTLAAQVERMLADPRSDRFIHEFLDQWLGLAKIDATTPDAYLYPEYDDVLRRAMLAQTRRFFAHLVDENLSVTQLVDSDFTFLNRKMAEHYGIQGVEGERVRKVELPMFSVRGGLLTHASIAKITANGTVTSPVKRGSFVLSNLLGLPPNPPPPGVGGIEPDTRGATTIRETLKKHQSVKACAQCHRLIDPPGFALECFDPVGNFRVRYRNSKEVRRTSPPGLRFADVDYDLGLPVDTSGTTSDGRPFQGIREYKAELLRSKEQIARNLLSQLVAFSTGGEIQFADRDVIENILKATQDDDYPLRSLIHQLVASPLFRNR